MVTIENNDVLNLLAELSSKFSISNKEPNIESWGQFLEVIRILREKFGREGILFRGQESANWSLVPTLQRQQGASKSLRSYYGKIDRIVEKLNSILEKKFEAPELRSDGAFSDEKFFGEKRSLFSLPCYELLVYLRHFGFPSPLLDWTSSPFIALYFAFERAQAFENRAIYALIERPFSAKAGFAGRSELYSFGPFTTTHPRHYLQQAQYTICAAPNYEPIVDWQLKTYESVVNPSGLHQNVILKLVVPDTLRREIMLNLYDYNLTEYSLKGGQESLMKTLAFEAFELLER